MSSAKDIAKKLNLSPATVSMVFNNKPGVSDETRRLVLKTAEEMEYTFRGKKTAEYNTITLLLLHPNQQQGVSQNPFFMEVIEGACLRAQQLKYNLQISYLWNTQDILTTADTLKESSGIILLPAAGETPLSDILENFQPPVVLLDRSCPGKAIDTITINNIYGAGLATEHLISLGHRKLCFFGSKTNSNKEERLIGYRRTVQKYPETADSADNIIYCEPPIDCDELERKLRALEEMPTGFVCANDWYAQSCIQVLQKMGVRIPQDVSVIGFDNTPLSALISPRLTTVNVPKQQMGGLAVERIHQLLTQPESCLPVKTEVYTELIVRESTAPYQG